MAPAHQRSINALKRAEELIALSRKQAALELLSGVIYSKKAKNTPMVQLEPIMIRFIDLCVELRRGKSIKEGLYHFKNAAQQSNSSSFEKVITHLLDISEGKLRDMKTEAKVRSEKLPLDKQNEFDHTELLTLKSVVLIHEINRIEQSLFSPWLKFAWDVYRNTLETLKSNNKFKSQYPSVAIRAFMYCLEYSRKAEFGRLCDLLRQYVSNIIKGGNRQSSHHSNTKDIDTIKKCIKVKFLQLQIAVEMQLWQEALRSVEDIDELTTHHKEHVPHSFMSNLCKELANVLLIAKNYPFHTEVLIRYYNIMLSVNGFTPSEQSKYTSRILIAALASIPQARSGFKNNALNKFDEDTHRTRRLLSLSQIPHYPSREYLIDEVISMGLVEQASSEAKRLLNLLEIRTSPLFLLTSEIQEVLNDIVKSDPDNKVYIAPLFEVFTIRLMQHLSNIYSTVSIDKMFKMTSYLKNGIEPDSEPLPPSEIEMHIIKACNRAGITVYVDHVNKCIHLSLEPFVPKKTSSASYSLQFSSSCANRASQKLSDLAKNLEECNLIVESIMGPDAELNIISDYVEALRASIPSLDEIKEEHNQIIINQKLIVERKAQIADEISRSELEEESLRLDSRYASAIQNKQTVAATPAYEQSVSPIVSQQAQKVRVQAPANIRGFPQKKPIVAQPVDESVETKSKLMQTLLGTAPAPDTEFKNKLKAMFRRADHLERAYRLEEIPFLEEDYKKQLERDEKSKKKAKEARLKYSRMIYESNMAIKSRLLEIVPHYEEYKNNIIERVRQQRLLDESQHGDKVYKIKLERIKTYKEQERKRAAAERERLELEKKREQERLEEEKKAEGERLEEERRKEERLREEEKRLQELQAQRIEKERKHLDEEEKIKVIANEFFSTLNEVRSCYTDAPTSTNAKQPIEKPPPPKSTFQPKQQPPLESQNFQTSASPQPSPVYQDPSSYPSRPIQQHRSRDAYQNRQQSPYDSYKGDRRRENEYSQPYGPGPRKMGGDFDIIRAQQPVNPSPNGTQHHSHHGNLASDITRTPLPYQTTENFQRFGHPVTHLNRARGLVDNNEHRDLSGNDQNQFKQQNSLYNRNINQDPDIMAKGQSSEFLKSSAGNTEDSGSWRKPGRQEVS